MADGDRQYLAGWLIVEDRALPWWGKMSDPSAKVMVVGEMGHAEWILLIEAWREVCRRDLDQALQDMAQRVGVEYTSTRTGADRRRTLLNTAGGTP